MLMSTALIPHTRNTILPLVFLSIQGILGNMDQRASNWPQKSWKVWETYNIDKSKNMAAKFGILGGILDN